MSWFAKATPKLKEGFTKTRESIKKNVASVAAYTETETKLLLSEAKRKLWCKRAKVEDPEFTEILTCVASWKASLECQRRCIRRVISNQRLLERSQRRLCRTLTQVPKNGSCGEKSAELSDVVKSRVQMLVPSLNLEKVANEIDSLLSNEYAEITKLRKRYQTGKNKADICVAKMEELGSRQVTESLHNEL